MALSDREKKVLEELERGLYADDAEFVQRVQQVADKKVKPANSNGSNPAAKLVAGSVLAVAGLSVLVLAVAIQVTVIGVIGFLIMLAGLVLGSSNWSNTSLSNKPKPASPKQPRGSFFEDRWNRRFDK